MRQERAMTTASALVKRLGVLAVSMVLISLAFLAVSLLWPIDAKVEGLSDAKAALCLQIDVPDRDIEGFLRETAGRDLIRPPQAQAAVKDTGLAERLAAKLDLQGVVQMRGQMIAYVLIKNVGVQRISEGDAIGEFHVKEVIPGKVTLTMEGVEVSLP